MAGIDVTANIEDDYKISSANSVSSSDISVERCDLEAKFEIL